jgi:hypothetical protein
MKLYHVYIETNKGQLLCVYKQGHSPTVAEQSAYLELQRTQSCKGYKTIAVIPEVVNNRPNVLWAIRKMA